MYSIIKDELESIYSKQHFQFTRCINQFIVFYPNGIFRDTRTSPLVELIKAGLLKTAATLVTCGYDFSHDEQFGQFDMSQNDWSIVYQYRPYKRINYENDVLLLENAIADSKKEEIPALALKCRKMIRRHLTCCSKGSEIESKIMSLPLPQKVKSFLSLRENTFEQEIIEILEWLVFCSFTY